MKMRSHHPLVLIVDDDVANLKFIGNLLKPIEVDIALASSGPELIKLLETVAPDLIILDIMMPGMSGFEVCRRLSRQNHTKEIPVIFLSARNDIETITQCFSMGRRDYIAKPKFTQKETTIANFIIQGKSTQEISILLNSSESTINFHRNNIRKKLGIKNKNENLQVVLKQLES